VTTGSDHEPTDAAQQMNAATQRLRDKAWMFAASTPPAVQPAAGASAADADVTPGAATAEP
jgi:hypothetical protein